MPIRTSRRSFDRRLPTPNNPYPKIILSMAEKAIRIIQSFRKRLQFRCTRMHVRKRENEKQRRYNMTRDEKGELSIHCAATTRNKVANVFSGGMFVKVAWYLETAASRFVTGCKNTGEEKARKKEHKKRKRMRGRSGRSHRKLRYGRVVLRRRGSTCSIEFFDRLEEIRACDNVNAVMRRICLRSIFAWAVLVVWGLRAGYREYLGAIKVKVPGHVSNSGRSYFTLVLNIFQFSK